MTVQIQGEIWTENVNFQAFNGILHIYASSGMIDNGLQFQNSHVNVKLCKDENPHNLHF